MKKVAIALGVVLYIALGGYIALKPSQVNATAPADVLSGKKVEFDDDSSIKKKGGSNPWICACPNSARTCYCRVD